MRLLIVAMGLLAMAAFGADDVEPVWPTDFAEQLAAQVLANTPSGDQIGISAQSKLIDALAYCSMESSGKPFRTDPLDGLCIVIR